MTSASVQRVSLATLDSDARLPLSSTSGVTLGHLAVILSPQEFAFVQLVHAARRSLAGRSDHFLGVNTDECLLAGDISILAAGLGDSALVLVPRVLSDLPDDGLRPVLSELLRLGPYLTSVFAASVEALPALDWMLSAYRWGQETAPGLVLSGAAHRLTFDECDDPDIGVGRWRAPKGAPKLIDLTDFDPLHPWALSRSGTVAERVLLSEHADLRSALTRAVRPTPVKLPGGIVVDKAIRIALRIGLRRAEAGLALMPPNPLGEVPSEFLRWLGDSDEDGGPPIGRYWRALHGLRPDLAAHFPDPGRKSYAAFAAWTDVAWRVDEAPLAVVPVQRPTAVPSVGLLQGGLNVVGYLSRAFSLAMVARSLVDCANTIDLGLSLIDCGGPSASRHDHVRSFDNELRFDTTLTVVNPEQYEVMRNLLGDDVVDSSRRRIGYWFWELEEPSDLAREALAFVDEIWVGSMFNQRAFQSITELPVRLIPVPLQTPKPSGRDRMSFGLPENRIIFLCTFDLMSVVERKNPFDVITAFRQAFDDGEGPVLVVKATSGQQRWISLERVRIAASGRSDIIIFDEYLSMSDQHALIAAADCLVSLHRSEGLGLHLAEAMALGVPVIATNYSGNLDFMDVFCAAMIDFQLVPVTNGEGVYAEPARWAQPDVVQASEWMRKLASDDVLRRRLGEAGRTKIAGWPSVAEIGATIKQVLSAGAN